MSKKETFKLKITPKASLNRVLSDLPDLMTFCWLVAKLPTRVAKTLVAKLDDAFFAVEKVKKILGNHKVKIPRNCTLTGRRNLMKKKVKTLSVAEHLKEKLKDPVFKKGYERELKKARRLADSIRRKIKRA